MNNKLKALLYLLHWMVIVSLVLTGCTGKPPVSQPAPPTVVLPTSVVASPSASPTNTTQAGPPVNEMAEITLEPVATPLPPPPLSTSPADLIIGVDETYSLFSTSGSGNAVNECDPDHWRYQIPIAYLRMLQSFYQDGRAEGILKENLNVDVLFTAGDKSPGNISGNIAKTISKAGQIASLDSEGYFGLLERLDNWKMWSKDPLPHRLYNGKMPGVNDGGDNLLDQIITKYKDQVMGSTRPVNLLLLTDGHFGSQVEHDTFKSTLKDLSDWYAEDEQRQAQKGFVQIVLLCKDKPPTAYSSMTSVTSSDEWSGLMLNSDYSNLNIDVFGLPQKLDSVTFPATDTKAPLGDIDEKPNLRGLVFRLVRMSGLFWMDKTWKEQDGWEEQRGWGVGPFVGIEEPEEIEVSEEIEEPEEMAEKFIPLPLAPHQLFFDNRTLFAQDDGRLIAHVSPDDLSPLQLRTKTNIWSDPCGQQLPSLHIDVGDPQLFLLHGISFYWWTTKKIPIEMSLRSAAPRVMVDNGSLTQTIGFSFKGQNPGDTWWTSLSANECLRIQTQYLQGNVMIYEDFPIPRLLPLVDGVHDFESPVIFPYKTGSLGLAFTPPPEGVSKVDYRTEVLFSNGVKIGTLANQSFSMRYTPMVAENGEVYTPYDGPDGPNDRYFHVVFTIFLMRSASAYQPGIGMDMPRVELMESCGDIQASAYKDIISQGRNSKPDERFNVERLKNGSRELIPIQVMLMPKLSDPTDNLCSGFSVYWEDQLNFPTYQCDFTWGQNEQGDSPALKEVRCSLQQ